MASAARSSVTAIPSPTRPPPAEKATELCTVPNLLGRTASEANSLASNAGLILRFTGATNSTSGSIVVLNQDVEAGAQVEPGTVISVQLGDTSLND